MALGAKQAIMVIEPNDGQVDAEEAFRQVVGQTHGLLFRLACRLLGNRDEAADVVQDTYIRAWAAYESLATPSALRSWLCQIARNVVRDRQRSKFWRRWTSLEALTPNSREHRSVELVSASERAALQPDELLQKAETARAVNAALAAMPPMARVILQLRELDGLTYEEIAEALGLNMGTVESRLHRARKALAKKLGRALTEGGER